MTTVVYDVNEQAGLALVADVECYRSRYIPLAEAAELERATKPIYYLTQLHYCARAHVAGLVVSHVDPLVPGWAGLDELESLRPKRYGEAKGT